jgi:hypothetical protein
MLWKIVCSFCTKDVIVEQSYFFLLSSIFCLQCYVRNSQLVLRLWITWKLKWKLGIILIYQVGYLFVRSYLAVRCYLAHWFYQKLQVIITFCCCSIRYLLLEIENLKTEKHIGSPQLLKTRILISKIIFTTKICLIIPAQKLSGETRVPMFYPCTKLLQLQGFTTNGMLMNLFVTYKCHQWNLKWYL